VVFLSSSISIPELINTKNPDYNVRWREEILNFFHLLLEPHWTLAFDFQFHDHFTDCRTPWTSDQLAARPLPKHSTTKHICTYKTFLPCAGFEAGFRASKDSSCLRPLGYRDLLKFMVTYIFTSCLQSPETQQ
jgi:hypothetical protein